MSALKVLSLHQPWASFLFLTRPGEDRPVKTFETRPGAPNGDMRPDGVRSGVGGCSVNRGDVIGIASTAAPDGITGPGLTEGGWSYNYFGPDGEYQACWCFRTSDEGRRGMTMLTGPGIDVSDEGSVMPFGVLLGTVRVVDAYPMIDAELGWQGDGDTPHQAVLVDRWKDTLTLVTPGGERDITDQLEYGDWTPGRWAIELADPVPTTERCPWCCGSGNDPDSRGEDFYGSIEPGSVDPCPVCEPDRPGNQIGRCDPIPVSGLQGVWKLTPARLRRPA
jgi:hypothetical protein